MLKSCVEEEVGVMGECDIFLVLAQAFEDA